MAKVIVERPRYGSRMPTKGKGYQRRRQRIAWEDEPKRERMKLRGGGSKHLNEHLSPLRRYLEGMVGRPWNKIFADVCRYLDRDSAVQDHVRDHLEDYVATCVIVENGRLVRGNGYGVGRPLYSLFYVCPRTGILKKNPNWRRWRPQRPISETIRFVDNYTAFLRKHGVWHVIEFRSFPAPKLDGRGKPLKVEMFFDVLAGEKISRKLAEQIHGRAIYARIIRPASKREIWRFMNPYPHTNLAR